MTAQNRSFIMDRLFLTIAHAGKSKIQGLLSGKGFLFVLSYDRRQKIKNSIREKETEREKEKEGIQILTLIITNSCDNKPIVMRMASMNLWGLEGPTTNIAIMSVIKFQSVF
jgi:hypothetical protein